MEDSDVCPHGEIVGDCPTCTSTCPHGYVLHECENCLWEVELGGSEKMDPLDIYYWWSETRDNFDLETFLDNLDTTPPREHVPSWHEVHLDDPKVQARYDRRVLIASTLVSVLRGHGLPLHYEVLTRMARDTADDPSIREDEVLSVLSRLKGTFVRIQPGIYALAKFSK